MNRAETFSTLEPFIRRAKGGENRLSLFVEGIRCPGCIQKIENRLARFRGLSEGRVNFSTNRLTLVWRERAFRPEAAIRAVEGLGFRLVPAKPHIASEHKARADKKLLLAMAVAGFGAANVMLLSISVWSGADGSMGVGTRTLFHWISALIALPVIAYSGRPFFKSALGALKARRLNMDVPISLAVILAAGLSFYETFSGGQHAYFDAALMLLFFLLVGRYLDGLARSKAHSVGEQFLALRGTTAILDKGGKLEPIVLDKVRPGMTLFVHPGDKIPADGKLLSPSADLDTSLLSGESLPKTAKKGDRVFAGMVNLSNAIRLRVGAVGEGTLLSEITRLMEAAEQQKSRYVRWADRAASIYAPAVHLAGALTFAGWWLLGGLGWGEALTIAISVLIITCPCALGIAVPAVQVVAIGRLLKNGIVIKSGDALEKLSTLKAIVFDKTGTLSTGDLVLENPDDFSKTELEIAGALAGASRHPLARALHQHAPRAKIPGDVREFPGKGLKGTCRGKPVSLGKADWVGAKTQAGSGPELWLRIGHRKPKRFRFQDKTRSDAADVIAALKEKGFHVALLSGDTPEAVRVKARETGIKDWHGGASPQQKLKKLEKLKTQYGPVMMVGDGLNDTPSLAMADVSASPTTAADLSQTAADIVFQGEKLAPLYAALQTARKAKTLVAQNFSLAVLYNLIAIPVAVLGYATPLAAAIAMSSSSILVTLNALRARRP